MNVEIGEKKKYSLYCTSNSVDQMKHENRNRLQIKFKYRRNLQNPIFGKIRYMKFKWRYQRRWFCVKQTEWKTACRCQNCNTNKPFGIRPAVSWEHHKPNRWKMKEAKSPWSNKQPYFSYIYQSHLYSATTRKTHLE